MLNFVETYVEVSDRFRRGKFSPEKSFSLTLWMDCTGIVYA